MCVCVCVCVTVCAGRRVVFVCVATLLCMSVPMLVHLAPMWVFASQSSRRIINDFVFISGHKHIGAAVTVTLSGWTRWAEEHLCCLHLNVWLLNMNATSFTFKVGQLISTEQITRR